MIPWWAMLLWAGLFGLFSFWVGGAMARNRWDWWRK